MYLTYMFIYIALIPFKLCSINAMDISGTHTQAYFVDATIYQKKKESANCLCSHSLTFCSLILNLLKISKVMQK